MKQRIILAVIIFLTLLATVVIAQPDGPRAQQYRVENRGASGGGYQLTGLVWQVTGTARGGNYQLLCPAASTQRGSGCCCTYLPITLRSFKP
jgi:4-amino-4-deoxy-L-arabinose transferase-like glycosyltransferase